ncbi:MAG: hypothetical protein IVW54_16870 [Candidatus Binataceae bacterium]|nr:hypothetical protein [Candidatus Binataceae bacterium]
MKLSLGTIPPTEPPPPAGGCPTAPDGYWINPENCTQWLPHDEASKVGDVCFFGTGLLPGRIRAGGNQANTKLYCGCMLGSPQMDSIVMYGGAAVLAYFLVPAPYKYWVAGPLAGLALLGATCGR